MEKLVALNADMARELRGVAVMSVPTPANSPGLALRQNALTRSLYPPVPASSVAAAHDRGTASLYRRGTGHSATRSSQQNTCSSTAPLCLTQSARTAAADAVSHTLAHTALPCRAVALTSSVPTGSAYEATASAVPSASSSGPLTLSSTSSQMLSKRSRDADAADAILSTSAAELKARHRLTLEAALAGTATATTTASTSDATSRDRVSPASWRMSKVLVGHQGWVWALAVDPSNTWFVSGGFDTVIKVWDLSTGALKLNLTGHKESVRGLALSTLSPYLFSASDDRSVKCWDLERNEAIRDFFGHKSAVHCVCAHPALDVVVSAGRDRTVRVWDIRSRAAVHTFTGHTDSVMSLLTQSWEPAIVSGGSDGMIYLWDLVAGKARMRLTRHKKPVRGLALDVAGSTLISCGADDIRVWDMPSGAYRHTASTLVPSSRHTNGGCLWTRAPSELPRAHNRAAGRWIVPAAAARTLPPPPVPKRHRVRSMPIAGAAAP